jgi:hypothetical protein
MEDAPMALSEDEIKIHRLVLNAIRRHAGAAVLTVSTIAKATGLDEKKVRWSIGCLRRANFFTRVTGLVWETPTSLLRLRRGIVTQPEDARTLLEEMHKPDNPVVG